MRTSFDSPSVTYTAQATLAGSPVVATDLNAVSGCSCANHRPATDILAAVDQHTTADHWPATSDWPTSNHRPTAGDRSATGNRTAASCSTTSPAAIDPVNNTISASITRPTGPAINW